MQLQDIFDRAVDHLLTQKAKSLRSVSNRYECAYRSHDGLKCAAGVFIADEHYNKGANHLDVYWPPVKEMLKNSGFPVNDPQSMKLLRQLQLVHDLYDVDEWKRELREVSRLYNLNSTVLEKYS